MAEMETYQCMRDAGETSPGIDLVIENLDEFACGYAGNCYCSTAADYVIRTPAPAGIG
jgi:hypothetical protein